MTEAHIGFVVAAYGVAAIVLIGMIVAVVVDYRAQRQALRRLEGRDDGIAP
jgi:heme exporter protein CcmD